MTVWLDGGLAEHGAIDPADRGFTLGDGLFETIRARGGAPCHLARHLARLRRGAALLGIPVGPSDAALAQAIGALLAAEDLGDAALRLTLTRGPAPRGVLPPAEPRPTLLITAGPIAPAPPARAIIAGATRRNEASPLSRVKSLNYLDGILARLEAERAGANEALLLNTQGRLAEATAASLVLLLEGALVTPPVADGALPGIARELLIERRGLAERPLAPEDLLRADSACLANSLGIRPLVSVDGRPIGDGGTLAAHLAGALEP